MRQLVAFVPRGEGRRALALAKENEAVNLACFEGHDAEHREIDVVVLHADNSRLDPIIHALQALPELRVTLTPQGVLALEPPEDGAPEQVTDVTPRSPLEIFLSGLQSIGSWKGFLGYAAAASVTAWIGLHTNTVYLLTASMLIAPFAGPAMTLALGTARGDRRIIVRSLLRYFASLLLTMVISFLLSLLFQQEIATEQMVSISLLSAYALLLPLVAGAAGALNLSQSERNSLVTAAGPGMLVAASLAPPATMIGMSAAIGQWSMVMNGAFLLLLQLVGINLAGAAVFALFGLKPQGVRYSRGRGWARWLSLAVTAVAVAALLVLQHAWDPAFERATRTQRMAALVKQKLNEQGQVYPVEVNVRFTRADIEGQNTALVTLFVQRRAAAQGSDAELQEALEAEAQQWIRSGGFEVTPLVDVTVMSP